MRRIVFPFLLWLCSATAFAATTGTCTVQRGMSDFGIKYVEFSWTSSDTGNVEKTTTEAVSGTLVRVVTNPGDDASSPTAAYDITLEEYSFSSLDVLASTAINRSQSANEQAIPVVGTYFQPAVSDRLVFKVSAAGDAKTGVCRIYFK